MKRPKHKPNRFPPHIRKKLDELELQIAQANAKAMASRASAARLLHHYANSLLPIARDLAERGRPRTLAVLAKIIQTPAT